MPEWYPCLKHNWIKTDRVGIMECRICGASGYQREIVNPESGLGQRSERVIPHICPGCQGATMQKGKKCPNCRAEGERLRKEREARVADELSNKQRAFLEFLDEVGGPVSSTERPTGSIVISRLKKKGLIVTRTQTVYEITDLGREILHQHLGEEPDDL